jgi:hypothetical protein
MFIDWPESSAYWVPQPTIDCPKLHYFPFGDGEQQGKIKFISRLGTGAHSHVFIVEIEGVRYALKVFQ